MSGIEAYNAGLSRGGVALAALGGAIMGAAVSGAFALGGMAMLGSNATLALTYYGIAVYTTMFASGVNYSLKSIAYGNEVTLEGLVGSTLSGFVEANISFFAGALAGRFGFYNLANKVNHTMAEGLIKKPVETLFRSLIFNLPASGIRSIFNYIFNRKGWI